MMLLVDPSRLAAVAVALEECADALVGAVDEFVGAASDALPGIGKSVEPDALTAARGAQHGGNVVIADIRSVATALQSVADAYRSLDATMVAR